MILQIDARSAMPPFEQLREQITTLVLAGTLKPGDRLPAIRHLANDLALAGGTVARAYRELESDGVVTTHGRHGTIIADATHQGAPAAQLLHAARRYAHDATTAGATLDDALTAVRVAFASERPA